MSSQTNMKATPARRSAGGSEWKSHASAVGRQVLAKWNSSAVSSRQVGPCEKTLTAPEQSMNLTHCTRSTHAIGWPMASMSRTVAPKGA